mmetsp:Transcript_15399/g.29014  ORF Transcript_15399/g.29014 Transcript_15399/m.29014 type:complete len:80 (-) Transcript_15399:1543-1782(-)
MMFVTSISNYIRHKLDIRRMKSAGTFECLPRNCLDLDVSCSDQAYKRHHFIFWRFGGLSICYGIALHRRMFNDMDRYMH